jgi:hypothetical protein
MDMILTVFGNMFSDGNTMIMALLIFLAAGTLAFSVMAALRVRSAVKKRTSRILSDQERASQGRLSPGFQRESADQAPRVHDQALLGNESGAHEGASSPARTGRYL